jgi:putative DNA primase/helicase
VDGGKLLRELEKFLRRYVVLREAEVLIVSAWVMASWCVGHFDRFAHLAITSPAKRCGKTRLLQALSLVCPRATFSPSISPAVLFRLIQKEHPTFLLDEAQMITRRGSESAEVLRELLNSGIDKEARAYRCGGPNRDEVQSFSVYGPKIVALIGELDEVLADRCIAIRMERKSKKDQVQAFRSRVAEAEALPIARKLARWSHDHGEKLGSIYDELEPFALANDRLAELLLPLQSVLKVADKTRLPELRSFAKGLDAADIAAESAGVRLLAALREIFTKANGFLPTSEVIHKLCERLEEPWGRWTHGSRITSEALARLLRPFGIRPHHSQDKSTRGYYCTDFTDVFARYLSPSPIPGKTRPSRPTRPKRKRRK